MNVKILTDSGCDLPRDIVEKLDIDMMPLMVIEEGTNEEFLDKETIKEETLYKNLRSGKRYKTAQVPLGILQEKFEFYGKNNIDTLYLCFSSGLSGLYQSTNIIRSAVVDKYPSFNIEILDTRAAASGFGIIVYRAARMAREGRKMTEIVDEIESYIDSMEHIITVEEMSYLYEGGRIGKIQALAGGLLNIRPIIDIDREGRLRFLEKTRGQKKTLGKIMDLIEERSKNADLTQQVMGISYGDNIELAEAMRDSIEERFKPKEIIMCPLGSSVVAHTGPSILGITFLNQNI